MPAKRSGSSRSKQRQTRERRPKGHETGRDLPWDTAKAARYVRRLGKPEPLTPHQEEEFAKFLGISLKELRDAIAQNRGDWLLLRSKYAFGL